MILEPMLPGGRYLGKTAQQCAAAGFGFSETVYAPSVRLPRHSHERACFCLILAGSYTETYGRQTRDCTAGAVVFHPPGEVHSDRHDAAVLRLFCVDVEPARLETLRAHAPILEQPAGAAGGPLAWLGMRLYREFQSADSFSALALEGLTLEIVAEASRRLAAPGDAMPRWMAQAEEFLRDGYTECLDLDTVAQVAGVHPVHLVRVFRRRHGCTPADFVRRLRIEAACRRLATSQEPLGEIALENGFADQSHFSRVFKRLTGLSPAEYRRGFYIPAVFDLGFFRSKMFFLDKTGGCAARYYADMNTAFGFCGSVFCGAVFSGKGGRSGCLALLLTAVALLVASAARAQDPALLLAQAKQAAGGDAWSGIQSLHLRYRAVAGGRTGTQEEWDDVRAGRFVTQSALPPTMGGSGFDGVSSWTQFDGGYSYVLGDEDTRLGAANQSYQTCRAYWFPERCPATLAYAGQRQEGARTLDILAVTPQGGRPFQIWIDRTTHLIDRFVEQQAEDVQIVRFSDYRPVNGIRLPFTVRTGDEDPQWDEVDTLLSAAVDVPLAPDQFALPPNPVPDFRFLDGKTSTTVPFRLQNNKIIFPVRIDGQGPFEAELDSGGNYIVQPALAKQLHLTSVGSSQNGGGGEGFVAAGRCIVRTLAIGSLRLTDQVYKILPFSEAAPERTLLGLQILKRFVVRVDFDRQTLTLTRPDRFAYRGGGTTIPFHFQDNQPEVDGMVDGIAGTFCIDTGDDGSLLLIAPFVRRYGLNERYGASLPYGGSAVGGATHGLMARAGRLALFGADGRPAVAVGGPLTRLSQQTGGFDADAYVSGNVGVGVLKQFNLIFDYDRQRIIFEKNKNFGRKDVFNRVGLRLKRDGMCWQVVAVFPGSPSSEAGVREGDGILAINGKNPAQLDEESRASLWTAKIGSTLSFLVQSGPARRTVTVTLRDLL